MRWLFRSDLPCGCLLPERLCPEAHRLGRAMFAAYGHAQATGDFRAYDLARDRYESHIGVRSPQAVA